jgi:hypothetical protein
VTHHDVRRIVLALPDAVEGSHTGHPDFRVQNRIFATIHHAPRHGSLTLAVAKGPTKSKARR